MIEPITISYEIDEPNAETFIVFANAINAIIKKMNILEQMTDRRYATNDHSKVLREHIDPNITELL